MHIRRTHRVVLGAPSAAVGGTASGAASGGDGGARASRRAKRQAASNRRVLAEEDPDAQAADLQVFGPAAGSAVAVPAAFVSWLEGLVRIDAIEFPEVVPAAIAATSTTKRRGVLRPEDRVALPPLVAMTAALLRGPPAGWLVGAIALPCRPLGVAYRPADETLFVLSSTGLWRLELFPGGEGPPHTLHRYNPESPMVADTVQASPPFDQKFGTWYRRQPSETPGAVWRDALQAARDVFVCPRSGRLRLVSATSGVIQRVSLDRTGTSLCVVGAAAAEDKPPLLPTAHAFTAMGKPLWLLPPRWWRGVAAVAAPAASGAAAHADPTRDVAAVAVADDDAQSKRVAPASQWDAIEPAPAPGTMGGKLSVSFPYGDVCPFSRRVVACGTNEQVDPVLVPMAAAKPFAPDWAEAVPLAVAAGAGTAVVAKGVATDGRGHWAVADMDNARLLIFA